LLKSGILLQAVWAMFLDSQNGLNMYQNSLQLFKRKSVASSLGYVLRQPRSAACIKTACNSSSENPLQAIWAMFWGSPGAQHAPKQLATDFRLKAKIRCKLWGYVSGQLATPFRLKKASVANLLGHVLGQLPTDFCLKANIRCKLSGLCFWTTKGLSMNQNSLPPNFV